MGTTSTQITASDTINGAALVFTTNGDVAGLRARIRHMAEMHNQMAGMRGSGSAGPGGHGMGMHRIPSYASAEEVPGGARLVLVPTDPSQLAALRQQVRMHVEKMQSGPCRPCPQCPTPPTPAPGSEQLPPGPEPVE
jgi:hypothetical protein